MMTAMICKSKLLGNASYTRLKQNFDIQKELSVLNINLKMKLLFFVVVAIVMTMSLNAQETCPACHGTKVSSAKEYPPTYGKGRQIARGNCPYCDDIYLHSHKTCPRCKGTGTIQSSRNSTNSSDYNSSASGNDGADYTALVTVLAGAFILSNDIYIYHAISSYKSDGQANNDGNGWVFGLRKTFTYSALEYGASYLKSGINYGGGYSESVERWGGHFNFVHQIFYNKTPDRLRIYIGPSINYVYDFGYGAIIGTEV